MQIIRSVLINISDGTGHSRPDYYKKSITKNPGKIMIIKKLILFLAACSLVFTGCDSVENNASENMVKGVSVTQIKKYSPSQAQRVAGSVETWKQENIGFEVGGRVEYVVDSGIEVKGRVVDEKNRVIRKGDVLARLNDKRYRLQVDSAKAEIDAARAKARALNIEIEELLPGKIQEAESQNNFAEKELNRAEELFQEDAISEKELDQARTAFETSRAALEQARASVRAKKAEYQAVQAKIARLQEALRKAELDLEDTVLRAPFSGRVARTHVIPGGFVSAGMPVVTLIIMDPIKTVLEVSPETDRRISSGDFFSVYPPGIQNPVMGRVYHKDSVADPATRTFEVTLMLRNRKIPVKLPENADIPDLPRIEGIYTLQKKDFHDQGPWYIMTDCLYRDDEGYYAMKVSGGGNGAEIEPVVTLEKVRIKAGEDRRNLIGIFVLREIEDVGKLNRDDLLAAGVPPGVKHDDRVLLLRERWMFRPGDVVNVELEKEKGAEGFYVPMIAVVKDENAEYVHAVQNISGNRGTILRIDVETGKSIGDHQRIRSDELKSGMKILVKGTHYVEDGEEVRIVEPGELLP